MKTGSMHESVGRKQYDQRKHPCARRSLNSERNITTIWELTLEVNNLLRKKS